jgi:hypothetical protein
MRDEDEEEQEPQHLQSFGKNMKLGQEHEEAREPQQTEALEATGHSKAPGGYKPRILDTLKTFPPRACTHTHTHTQKERHPQKI